MSDPAPQRRRLVETEPAPAIALSVPARGEQGARWGVMLIWFMRVVAVIWLALGLVYWLLILDPAALGAPAFETSRLARQGAVVFFAVLNCVAAIGLWLAAPWGGVVWLFTALSEIALAIVLPGVGFHGQAALILNGALIGIYFVLNFFAAREGQER